jgi:pimeloyl-ACP methyl ester carboxylesterase
MFTSPEGEARVTEAYRTVLTRWPVPYAELIIPTSFGDTHVIASGSAENPPLVLMHAFFATATVWYPNVGSLSRQYRTYAVDIIGDANMSRPTRRITKLEDYAQWFGELLDGLGVRKVSIVGNSFGAFLSAYFAMSIPERIRCLVLIGPAATFHGIAPFYLHMFLPKALCLFFPKLPEAMQARMMKHGLRWAFAGLPHDRVWAKLFYRILMYGNTASQVFPKVFSREELSRIKAPILLLIGDRERIYRVPAVMQAARKLKPGIQIAMIRNAHHITAMAQPEIVNGHILRFLGEWTSERRKMEILRKDPQQELAVVNRALAETSGLAR